MTETTTTENGHRSKGTLDQDDAKSLLLKEDYLALQARCVREFGPAAGIFIRQLIYWTGKSVLGREWLFKTISEMQEETGLSRRQQDKARKILTEAGVLQEARRGVPPKMHYRVVTPNLVQSLKLRYIVPGNSEQFDLPGNTEQINSSGNSEQDDPPANSGQNNSPAISDHAIQRTPGEHARLDNRTKKTPRDSTSQVGAGSLSGRPTPQSTKKETDEKPESWRDHFDGRECSEVMMLLSDEATNLGRMYGRYLEGRLTLEDVAGAVSHQRTGGADKAKPYVLLVKAIDDHLRDDLLTKSERDASPDEGLVGVAG